MNLSQLSQAFRSDPDSAFHRLRYRTKSNYIRLCGRLEREYGAVEMNDDLDARMLLRWHRDWAADGKVAMGHAMIGMIRTLATFGATLLKSKECRELKILLHDMRFEMPASRKERLTAPQVVAIRQEARSRGAMSVALCQAFQFDCTFRQGDCIGTWLPLSEAGVSDVIDGDEKWLGGITWAEIDENWILTHITSKKQKEVVINLKLAPMVMEELRIAAGIPDGEELDRDYFPWSRPVIINESTGLPYRDWQFRRDWRKLATDAGIPAEVFNMDSRAGAISEATDAGAPLEDVRHAAAHSNTATTAKYSRGQAEKTARVMKLRVAARGECAAVSTSNGE